jgi:CRISPR-associated protein Csb1
MSTRVHPNRQLFDVDLEPIAGSRFQATGFPDLGSATFTRLGENADPIPALLVESTQSMANHLEAAAWDVGSNEPVGTFAGLPYVRVVHEGDGGYLTSSRTESHRLAAAFVKDSTLDGVPMREVIRERLQLDDDRPLAAREIAAAVFRLDPFALIHGVFFAESAKVWPGQPKILRALTAFVEALDVERADSGGVKRDHVRHQISEGAGGATEGYGSVPFHRTEWTARQIIASFNLDLAQLRSYGLPGPATQLLAAIARWEIRALLDEGLRLRTACDLVPIDDDIRDRNGDPMPSFDDLDGEVRSLIAASQDFLEDGAPIEVVWSPSAGKAKEKGK